MSRGPRPDAVLTQQCLDVSQFFSRKYLLAKQRETTAPSRITSDLACTACGYNLKGLSFGRNCPECGTQIDSGPALDDVMLQGNWARRNAWRLGFATLFVCLLVVTAARLLMFLAGVWGAIEYAAESYVVTLLLVSFVWLGAAWSVTPSDLGRFTMLRHLRHFVRLTQILWPMACALWLVGTSQSSATMVEWARALRLIAGSGVLAMIVILMRISVWAELDEQARRFNAALWLLPITTLLVQAFPGQVAWFTMVPMGLFLGLWAWVMLVFAFAATSR